MYNFLNLVDHGTNYQMVCLVGGDGLERSAFHTWATYAKSWLKYFGPPEVLLTDGGTEFRGDFERRLEQSGTFQAVTDADSPWQNGRTERHDQWMQEVGRDAVRVDADRSRNDEQRTC